jgi:Protein of unknown function, DUF481
MTFCTKTFLIVAASLALFDALPLRADTVETMNGAKLVGKLTKIDAGVVYLDTDYAGTLQIKQSQVTAIETDKPVAVRLASGTRIAGPVTMSPTGALQVVGEDGTISTTVEKVAAVWQPGDQDPEIVALQRHWQYEATLDVNGTTGNKEQLGTAAGFSAKLITPQDTLQYSTSYNRQVTSGVKSADQFNAGVDYANYISKRSSWFVRDEAGFDRIMDIKFYDTAAAGYGWDLIHNSVDVLTVRAGLAYRYTGYNNPMTPMVSSAAADFEILHDLKEKNWELANKISAVPAFANVADLIVTQDSFYQVPLLNPAWKLRIGVSNDYNGEPGAGIKRLDTTYYTRFILDWTQ